MSNVQVTEIPIPSVILNGWGGIVYAINTEALNEKDHHAAVESAIRQIEDDFDSRNHHTVSLQKTRQELVYQNDMFKRMVTLVSFRVRDSY